MKLPSNTWFHCKHLLDVENPLRLVENFTINPDYPDGQGLSDYLMSAAFHDERYGECRTYLVLDNKTRELAAYFTLRVGFVSRKGILDEQVDHSFDTLSGIELVCFAVNHSYVIKHPGMKGFGIVVFNEMILPIVSEIGLLAGAPILYGYAVNENKLMDYYVEKCGFLRLPLDLEKVINEKFKPRFDRGCYFIYKIISEN